MLVVVMDTKERAAFPKKAIRRVKHGRRKEILSAHAPKAYV